MSQHPQNKMGTMPVGKLLISMSLPAMFSMLIQALYNVVDSIYVAQIGEDALTAVSLAFPVQNFLIAVSVGTCIGLNSLISRRLGERREHEASLAATHGVLIALVEWVGFLIFGLFFCRIFFQAFTDNPTVIQMGIDYTSIVTIFSFGCFVEITLEKTLQATGNMIYPMLFQLTGAITNIAPIIKRAHEVGSIFILDACQSVPHLKVDFHALDVDFAAWSAHKMYGPTGVGFLYGKRDLLEALPPANFGGSMVELAYMDHEAQYMAPPARFEAGTQPVAQVVAAGVAAEWMMNIGLENIEAHEKTIAAELLKLGDVDGIRILGPRENVDRIGTVAFDVAGVHPHDVGQFIDAQGIAIRVGHHCAQPVHRHFGLYASNRASSGVYNSVEDAQALVEAAKGIRKFFGVE